MSDSIRLVFEPLPPSDEYPFGSPASSCADSSASTEPRLCFIIPREETSVFPEYRGSANLASWLQGRQHDDLIRALRRPRDTEPPPTPERGVTDDAVELMQLEWWGYTNTGGRLIGATLIAVSLATTAGLVAIGSEFLIGAGLGGASMGGISWGLGAATATHEGLWIASSQLERSRREAGEPTPKRRLIRQAQEALESWKTNHSSSFDFGNFFVEAEGIFHRPPLGGDEIRAHQGQWSGLVREIRSGIDQSKDIFTQLRQLRLQLHLRSETGHYRLRNSGLIGMLEGVGGNCSARGRTVAAFVAALRLRLPQPWVWGIQVFRGHVEAIAYHPRTHQVLDLRTGRRSQGLTAPLYAPHVLLHAFLRRQGAPSPVSDRELLLANPPAGFRPAQTGQALNDAIGDPNDILDFPSSDYPANGSTPEEAFEPAPQSSESEDNEEAPRTSPTQGGPSNASSGGTTPYGFSSPDGASVTFPAGDAGETPPTGQETASRSVEPRHPLSDHPEGWAISLETPLFDHFYPYSRTEMDRIPENSTFTQYPTPIFRTAQQADTYNALTRPEDRALYLAQIHANDLQRFLRNHAEDLGRVVEQIEHPERLLNSDQAFDYEASTQLRNTLEAFSEFQTQWQTLRRDLKIDERHEAMIATRNPELRRMETAIDRFWQWTDRNARTLLESVANSTNSYHATSFLEAISRYPISPRLENLGRELAAARYENEWTVSNRPSSEQAETEPLAIDLPQASGTIEFELWSESPSLPQATGVRSASPSPPGLTLPLPLLFILNSSLPRGSLPPLHEIWRPSGDRIQSLLLSESYTGNAYEELIPAILRERGENFDTDPQFIEASKREYSFFRNDFETLRNVPDLFKSLLRRHPDIERLLLRMENPVPAEGVATTP